MRAIGFRLAAGVLVPVAAGSAAAQPPGAAAGGRRELASPPGWVGPGPAVHKWDYPGPGTSWRYYGLPDAPYTAVHPVPGRPHHHKAAAVGVGVGVGAGYGYGPFFGGIPGAFGSFWTNGRSLYGPPVPTYGPTPGVFGATDDDKRFFTNPPPANSLFFGLGWLGYRSPSPRHTPLTVSVLPPPPPALAPPAVAPAGLAAPGCITLTVRVPDPAADVWIEKTAMPDKGAERVFRSPPLEDGQTYRYEVVARWAENGRPRAESRAVVAKPGEAAAADFTRPADDAPAN